MWDVTGRGTAVYRKLATSLARESETLMSEPTTSGPTVPGPTPPVAPLSASPTDPAHGTAGEHHFDGSRASHLKSRAAATGAVAAAVLLVVTGALQILEGISAVQADEIIVIGPQYAYQWNATGWGVVHIVVGALIVGVAAAVFAGRTWARITAIVLTGLSIVANFLWLPHNPWWSVLIIALDAFLIWALATWHHTPAHHGSAATEHAAPTPH